MPKVSVVMPCYNAANHIAASAQSVLTQTMKDLELIVVDDGSSDHSPAVVQQLLARDSRMCLLSQRNRGPSAARNRGLDEASGDYIAFLDADDTWAPGFLEHMTEALDRCPDAVLAYCGWQNLGLEGGRSEPFIPPDYQVPEKMYELLEGGRWPIHGALTQLSVIREAGGFESSLGASEDYDLWLRIATDRPIVRVPEVLAFYHHHGADQLTSNRAKLALCHWRAQRRFLHQRPEVKRRLGRDKIRRITLGELERRGMEAYWAGDIAAARRIFMPVWLRAYGLQQHGLYMLFTLLPASAHAALRRMRHAR